MHMKGFILTIWNVNDGTIIIPPAGGISFILTIWNVNFSSIALM